MPLLGIRRRNLNRTNGRLTDERVRVRGTRGSPISVREVLSSTTLRRMSPVRTRLLVRIFKMTTIGRRTKTLRNIKISHSALNRTNRPRRGVNLKRNRLRVRQHAPT